MSCIHWTKSASVVPVIPACAAADTTLPRLNSPANNASQTSGMLPNPMVARNVASYSAVKPAAAKHALPKFIIIISDQILT